MTNRACVGLPNRRSRLNSHAGAAVENFDLLELATGVDANAVADALHGEAVCIGAESDRVTTGAGRQ